MQNPEFAKFSHSSKKQRRLLWKAALKLPIYSVSIMPVLIAIGWSTGEGLVIKWDQVIIFLFGAIILLLWENLSNDIFDSETGVDEGNKPHSIVSLIGNKYFVSLMATGSLLIGLVLIIFISLKSSFNVFFLVLSSCLLGYLYQGPPFRLGYKGLGEPLCWIAFGPLATAAALIAISPTNSYQNDIPWLTSIILSAGPATATTIVLFCSHFHQVKEDAEHGKLSPLVRIGTSNGAIAIPWLISFVFALELIPAFIGIIPLSSALGIIGFPYGLKLINLVKKYHNKPEKIKDCKFIALQFQLLNGLGFSIGLALHAISFRI